MNLGAGRTPIPSLSQADLKAVVVAGDVHGQLQGLVQAVERLASRQGLEIDLVLQVGDLEAIGNAGDLASMPAVRHRQAGDFHLVMQGRLRLPWELCFLAGNHEPVARLACIPQGGVVGPRCRFLGRSGWLRRNGLLIAWLSGLHQPEVLDAPLVSDQTWLATRRDDLKALADCPQRPDLLLSHDWPLGLVTTLPGRVRREPPGHPMVRMVCEQLRPVRLCCGHHHLAHRDVIDWPDGQRTTIHCLARAHQPGGLVALGTKRSDA